ncbi:hypothetical protein [Falsirhodobacter sp. alg1]|uniref:hypothetical protein n=1 Tax=Falsirhodobacter sp. alg1 TaxID=1472418 RepID=UPI0006938BB5|nr:hypothetical protein [Falsirhodobacter sp. alg1]
MPTTRFTASGVFFSLAMLASPALADGEFVQSDIAKDTRSFVGAVSRDAWSFGGNATRYDGGRSGGVQVTYGVPLAGIVTAHVGPTIGFENPDDDDTEYDIGALASLDRYVTTGFGGVYGLAQVSTIYDAWFVLGQISFADSGFGIELSSGGSESYSETTIALQKRFTGTPVSLRTGYKTDAKEYFIGFSFNTF